MFKIRAIVFDSNVFGKSAQPNVKTIEQWAEACGWHDAELWISEIVAQHAIEEHDTLINSRVLPAGSMSSGQRRLGPSCGRYVCARA